MNEAGCIRHQISDIKAFIFKEGGCMQNCMMFNSRDDDVISFTAKQPCAANKCPAVRFRAAGSKKDTLRISMDQGGSMCTRVQNGTSWFIRKIIQRRGISPFTFHIRDHSVADLWQRWGRCGMIKIDLVHKKGSFLYGSCYLLFYLMKKQL